MSDSLSGCAEAADLLVVGASLGGLRAAAEKVRAGTGRVLLVDRAPRVGGSVRTQRSEGFVCELGPPFLPQEEFRALAALLDQPPRAVELDAAARLGQVLRGGRLEPAEVAVPLEGGRGGLEDLLVAYHRQLAPFLRLGREVTALVPAETGLVAHLGGEHPSAIAAARVALATPADATAMLLAAADPRLREAALQLRRIPVADLHLGWWTSALEEVPAGHGIRVAEPAETGGITEALWCSNHFPARSLPGRFLARIACEGDLALLPDPALEDQVLRFLAVHAGITRTPIFRRTHRASSLVADGHLAALHVRIAEAAQRWPALSLVG